MKLNNALVFYFIICSSNILSDDYVIKTTSGITYGQEENAVISWDDIPYAKPPIGDLRWRAPQDLDVSSINNIIRPKEDNFCVQEPSGLGGSEGDDYFSGSEDCLYLDIKAPLVNDSQKLLPVMFWIHGGGNTSGLKDLYDFSTMTKNHEVLIVTINYRLGPFGWFTHPSIQGQQAGLDKTSNFGTLDIIQALKWVNRNISNFGGDPNNVTIFGESAGGHNVLSLLVTTQAKGLFHKAISQSGYTTTYSLKDSYRPSKYSSTSKHSSWNVVNQIIEDKSLNVLQTENDKEIRNFLKNLSSKEFFRYYSQRPSYENLPLLTADGLVIPKIGLTDALSKKEYLHSVPIIAGSNRDEVKLWLASAKYFVDLDYSFFGSIFGVPKVVLNDKDAFNLFNSYRSKAWKIRGVDGPLRSLYEAGNNNLYAYRYDWDDHRRFIIGDFKQLIGAAHATEIPLLTGNNKLVGDYGFLIYPKGPSKRFTSKNMMQFWTNFAKNGEPGFSTNGLEWKKYNGLKNASSNYMILDKRKELKMKSDNFSFSSLIHDLYKEDALTDLEKCVVLLQMLTYVGDDLYDEYVDEYPGNCSREKSEQFLKDNASFIDY
jgi:para-nitrobenzyl esterase